MPYASDKQRRFFHTETARRAGITPEMVAKWDAEERRAKHAGLSAASKPLPPPRPTATGKPPAPPRPPTPPAPASLPKPLAKPPTSLVQARDVARGTSFGGTEQKLQQGSAQALPVPG